jgi:hypothetical protein
LIHELAMSPQAVVEVVEALWTDQLVRSLLDQMGVLHAVLGAVVESRSRRTRWVDVTVLVGDVAVIVSLP